jgi:hypothetical protein
MSDAAHVTVEIRGVELPGRTCGPHHGIRVGLRQGSETVETVAGDATRASWEAPVKVRAGKDGYDFTGASVRGRRGERFLALGWLDGTGHLFRAAKLPLTAADPDVVRAALENDTPLVATVHLTDEDGLPRCATVKAPHLVWSAG